MFAWRPLPSRPGAGPGAYLTVPSLASAGIRVAFTTRLGGHSDGPYASLNLSYSSGDDPVRVRANRGRVLEALGLPPGAWTSGHQVHGTLVAHATGAERGAGADSPASTLPGTDGLWTSEAGIAVAVLSADCVPVLLADAEGRRVGVVHAGWRGLLAGALDAGVAALDRHAAMAAYIGPAIGPCCYEVGEDVAGRAAEALGPSVVRAGDPPRLDLWLAAVLSLRRAGVREIRPAALCTRCEPHRFFSHRAGAAGRQGLVAAIA